MAVKTVNTGYIPSWVVSLSQFGDPGSSSGLMFGEQQLLISSKLMLPQDKAVLLNAQLQCQAGSSSARPQARGQRDFSIPGILDESPLHFFSLDHEK